MKSVSAPPPEPPTCWRRVDLLLVRKAVQFMLLSPVVSAMLETLLDYSNTAVKEVSHLGAVSFKGNPRDVGNFAYSCFWQCMLAAAADLGPNAHPLLFLVSERWPSIKETLTKRSQERAGDVMEFLLGYWHSVSIADDPRLARCTTEEHRGFSDNIHCGLRACHRLVTAKRNIGMGAALSV